MKYLLNFLIFFLIILSGNSQVTKIMGKIYDSKTKEPLPFVNIILKGTSVGAITNLEGEFTIETKVHSDSIIITCMGFKKFSHHIKKNNFQKIDIELEPINFELGEVVIKYQGNPADEILKQIRKNKDNNNVFRYEYSQYEVYNKIQFDINNIDEKFKNQKNYRKFDFIFNYLDTSTVNGKVYLPVFLSESVSDVYFRKNPKTKKEYLNAVKISGIDNRSIGQFMSDLYLNINVYDNYLPIFDKNFISPIANFGNSFYKYYLVDSLYKDSIWCYNIVFHPKRPQELTFTGNFWVADSSWAIKEMKMDVAKDANINFINGVAINQEFTKTDDNFWVLSSDKVVMDFNIVEKAEKTTGFYGRKTTSYKKHKINIPKDEAFYSTPLDVYLNDDAYDKDEIYWHSARHDSLSSDEKTIYFMIDTLKSLPIIKNYIEIAETLIYGYWVKGNFELGPYMSFLSFNGVEGTRLRIGGRTSNAFSTRLLINAHIAYGTKDTKLKYGTSFIYMLNKNPRQIISGGLKHDMEQLGQSQNAFREDFLLAAIFHKSPADKLSMVNEYYLGYEHEWFTGFSTKASLINRNIYPLGNTKFLINENEILPIDKKFIATTELTFSCRFAFREKYLVGEFERISLGTRYPIFEFKYSYSIPELFGSDYTFNKIQLGINHWFNVGSFGWSKYIIEGGKIFSKLPYPLLKIHEGNNTWFYDPYSFNTMNFYEFVSDQYLSISWNHHFDGLFLNKIPLMRKLKWREVLYFKGLVGCLDTKNERYSEFPEGLSELSKPYFETGFGIENIFKFIRVDAIWRLSSLDKPDISKYGIFASFQFSF